MKAPVSGCVYSGPSCKKLLSIDFAKVLGWLGGKRVGPGPGRLGGKVLLPLHTSPILSPDPAGRQQTGLQLRFHPILSSVREEQSSP